MGFKTPCPRDLRDRITLQAHVPTPNISGGIDDAYSDVASVWARVVQVFGEMILSTAQTEARVTHLFTIRNRTDFGTSWRYMTFNGDRYRAHRAIEQGTRREWLEIQAEKLGDAS